MRPAGTFSTARRRGTPLGVKRRGQSTVGTLLGFSGAILTLAFAGYLWPTAFEALVADIGAWVAARVELP